MSRKDSLHKGDGNLSPWLEQVDASMRELSVKANLPSRWDVAFRRHLSENPDAGRLVRDILPKCNAGLAGGFVMLVVSGVDCALIPWIREQGQELRKTIRAAARNDKIVRTSPEAQEFNRRAGRAFDTRRQGLAEYCFGALILRRYLHFRSGVEPTARELAALLSAGLAAGGRLQAVDHDLLRRNLRNYEKKHPHPLATGERCAQIIEVPRPK